MNHDVMSRLVRESFADLRPHGAALVHVFYQRLFLTAPHLRGMFGTDLQRQSEKLLGSLSLVVDSLDRLDEVSGALRMLGAAHAGLGVRPAHYMIVIDILMETFADTLGPAWSPATEVAWRALLSLVAAEMLEGAADTRSAEG